MTAHLSGGGGDVILVAVLALLVVRLGYAATRAKRRRQARAGADAPEVQARRPETSSQWPPPPPPNAGDMPPRLAGGRDEDASLPTLFDPGQATLFDPDQLAPPTSPALDGSGDGRPPADGSPPAWVLDVRRLSVSYGQKKAVDDVSFGIVRGEIFGLLGPNGAGKTTTLSAIEGLVRPQAGTILLDGIDVARRSSDAKARMGVQLQATSFQAQLTIRQIVRLYAGLYGVRMSDGDITRRLEANGLGGEANKPFKELSGGQQQRLSLLIAVIHDPTLLLLDEPTAGLDPQSRRHLWSRMEQIRKGGGSILLTTHSMEEAQAVCDRVSIIDHGSLLTTGAPRELIEKHKHDPRVLGVAHGDVTLEDVFIGLTGSEIRD